MTKSRRIPPVRSTEKRLVSRALSYWEHLRGGRSLPAVADISGVPAPFDDEHLFIVKLGRTEQDDEIVAAGNAVAVALGYDPVGTPVNDVLPSAREKGLAFCRAVAELKKPLADVGRFFNRAGREVTYRSILLPFSDDQRNVNYVIGAFSCKFS
jgi:hypothetical protein